MICFLKTCDGDGEAGVVAVIAVLDRQRSHWTQTNRKSRQKKMTKKKKKTEERRQKKKEEKRQTAYPE